MKWLKRVLLRLGVPMAQVLHSESGKVEFKLPNPGIGWTWLVDFLIKALGVILPVLTPTIRESIEEFLSDLYGKAKETPNPWDDFFVKFLMRIVGIEVPE